MKAAVLVRSIAALSVVGAILISLRAQQSAGPALSVSVEVGNTIQISWPATASQFVVEESEALGPAATWRTLSQLPTQQGNQFSIRFPPAQTIRFYRLRQTISEP